MRLSGTLMNILTDMEGGIEIGRILISQTVVETALILLAKQSWLVVFRCGETVLTAASQQRMSGIFTALEQSVVGGGRVSAYGNGLHLGLQWEIFGRTCEIMWRAEWKPIQLIEKLYHYFFSRARPGDIIQFDVYDRSKGWVPTHSVIVVKSANNDLLYNDHSGSILGSDTFEGSIRGKLREWSSEWFNVAPFRRMVLTQMP